MLTEHGIPSGQETKPTCTTGRQTTPEPATRRFSQPNCSFYTPHYLGFIFRHPSVWKNSTAFCSIHSSMRGGLGGLANSSFSTGVQGSPGRYCCLSIKMFLLSKSKWFSPEEDQFQVHFRKANVLNIHHGYISPEDFHLNKVTVYRQSNTKLIEPVFQYLYICGKMKRLSVVTFLLMYQQQNSKLMSTKTLQDFS